MVGTSFASRTVRLSSKIISRTCLAAIAAASVLGSSATAGANGLVVPTAVTDPSTLDIETAIAVTPSGTTRWSRIHFGGSRKALWLVPVRPGAAIDWAPDTWLDALDDATATRVLPPTTIPPCNFPSGVERTPTFVSNGTTQAATNLTVASTQTEALNRISSLGYRVSATLTARIAALYGAGSALATVEITSSSASGTNVSPTIRVSDDGRHVLPLALLGSDNVGARVSAFVIGSTAATIDGSTQITTNDLAWGSSGSSFFSERAGRLSGGNESWLRESASVEALFSGVSDSHIAPLPSVVADFFGGSAACTNIARQAAATNGTLGRVCAPGLVAQVPGGTACTPTTGTLDPASFKCGASIDLALAVAGGTPANVWITRFSGYIPAGTFGSDVSLGVAASAKSPVVEAGSYAECHPPIAAPNGIDAPQLCGDPVAYLSF